MTAAMFTTLIRKDFRVFRPAAIGLVISTAVLYALGISIGVASTIHRLRYNSMHERILDLLSNEAFIGMSCVAVVATAFGGMAFAAERRERSAEFLSALPVSRLASAISKLLIAIPIILAAFVLNVVIELVGENAKFFENYSIHSPKIGDIVTMFMLADAMLVAFSFAWLLSSFTRSAAISACAGIGCGFTAFMAAEYCADWKYSTILPFCRMWTATSVVVSLLIIALGTIVYVRRIEP